MSANRSPSSEHIWRTIWPGYCLCTCQRQGDLNAKALTPSSDSPATRRASRGRLIWGTQGARAASLRVTLTWFPRDATVVSGGQAKLRISAQNAFQTFRRNSQTMIVPQRPPQAPVAKQTSSVTNQTAALVRHWCRCRKHQRTRRQRRRERHLYPLRTVRQQKHRAQTQSSVHSPLQQNAPLSQPQSQKAMFHPRSEQEWGTCQRVRSLHRHLCLHHHQPRLAVAPNSGAANVAIAAKPNWSWFSKSWVPVAVGMSSVCSTGSRSSTSVCSTTWAGGARRRSWRWWSSTARWAAPASASERSAPDLLPRKSLRGRTVS